MMPSISPATTEKSHTIDGSDNFRHRLRKDSSGTDPEEKNKIVKNKARENPGFRGKEIIFMILVSYTLFRFLIDGMITFSDQMNEGSDETKVGELTFRNERPIIGIITMDTPPDDPDKDLGSLRVAVSYVRFLEQAGALVVPIRGGEPESYYAQMVNWTNGVVFPGGSAKLFNTSISRAASIMFNLALKLNREGEYYPVWGTCWGLQMMSYLVAGREVNLKTDSRDAMWPLDFTPEATNSRLFGSAPKVVLDILSTQPVTQHHHNWSVPTEAYYNTDLSKFFKVLSTNKDRNGVEFVSTLEGRDYPIYAIQWHPEKPLFLWDPNQYIGRSPGTLTVGHYIADFIVNEARKSSHRFPNMEKEAEHLMWNNRYKFKYGPEEYFLEFYYMNPQIDDV